MLYMLIDLFCGAVVPLIAVLILCKLDKNGSAKKTILLVLFVLYLAEMFDVVGIPAIQNCSWDPVINLIPFSDFGADGFSFQVIANAILFLPFGFLLPLIWKSFRKFSATVLAGLITSVCIEITQLFCFRATDIDDLLMNTLGTVIGYLILWLFAKKKWKAESAAAAVSRGREIAELIVVVGLVFLSAVLVKALIGNVIYGLPLVRQA